MRIIHLISGGDVGGAKTHVLSLVKGLSVEHEVLLACFVSGAFSREAIQMGIDTAVFEGLGYAGVRRRLLQLIRERKADLVHCHGSRANLMGRWLKMSTSVPVITTVHSDPKLDYMGRPLRNLTYGTANRLALRGLDGWVCVSDQLKKSFDGSGFDPHYTFTITNGIDFSCGDEEADRGEFWRCAGVPVEAEDVVFGIAARLTPVKDIPTLIRAFSQVCTGGTPVRLAIAGDGEQKDELMALAKELCPEGRVHFLGWVSDMKGFFRSIDVNMLTSVSEGLPYAIPEGARMRRATIATAVGAIPRIVRDGQTGFLVRPGDVDALAERMSLVAHDRQLRLRLGQALYDFAKEDYSIDAMVRLQTQIYQDILVRKEREAQGRDGVLICGAYGKGNVGDETILDTILQQFRQRDRNMPVCVMSRNPGLTAECNGVRAIFTFNPIKTVRAMKRSVLFISGGGSLIQDATSTRSLLFYLHSIQYAHKHGCKVMMYGCGIGPVRRNRNRRRAAAVIGRCVDIISLRDLESRVELERMGVKHPAVWVTADPALLQRVPEDKLADYERFLREVGMDPQGKYCLFSLRPWGSANQKVKFFADMAEYVYRKHGLTPVFFSFEPERDQEITQCVADMVSCPKIILPDIAEYPLIGALIRDMKLVCSMRLHALIFAAGQGTPVVGISYDPKVKGFMDYMGQKSCVELNDITGEALCEMVDKAITTASEGKKALPALRALAEQNDKLAWKLIRGESVSQGD